MMRKAAAVTAKQVAERSGVSISTVGRALANDPRISVKTKAIVRKAANNLGYIESSAARIMRGGSSKLVGLMLPNIRNDFYSMIAEALSKCCDDQGYQLALSLADNPDSEARHLKELASAHVAGIVIVPTSAPKRETKALLRRFPHVQLLRRIPAWQSPWFGIDDEDCLRAGAAHLIGLGHRRIAYIGGSADFSTGAARLKGFRRAIREGGMKRENTLEALGPPTFEFGVEALERIIRRANYPSALITGSVQITQSALEVLHRLRIATPKDISVVGFGDAPGFDWWGPGLTTMRMPVQELATACGLWFLNHLQAKSTLEPGYAALAKAEFVLRKSTAPAARRAA